MLNACCLFDIHRSWTFTLITSPRWPPRRQCWRALRPPAWLNSTFRRTHIIWRRAACILRPFSLFAPISHAYHYRPLRTFGEVARLFAAKMAAWTRRWKASMPNGNWFSERLPLDCVAICVPFFVRALSQCPGQSIFSLLRWSCTPCTWSTPTPFEYKGSFTWPMLCVWMISQLSQRMEIRMVMDVDMGMASVRQARIRMWTVIRRRRCWDIEDAARKDC